jgi:hypothetical protein
MRPSLLLSAVFFTSFAALLATPSTGCAPSEEETGSGSQASTAEDLALAKEVVSLLGGDEGRCNGCHNVSATKVRAWGTAMKQIEDTCLAPAISDAEKVNCLRVRPGDAASAFSAARLGLYATGVASDSFKGLFDGALGAGAAAEYTKFKQKGSMPRGEATPLSAAEFAKVKGWVLRGMPQLDVAFGGPAPDAGPAGVCNPSTTPELAAHITRMKTEGWGARLADQATPMFGCAAGGTLDCLGTYADDAPTFGTPNLPQKIRHLQEQPLKSRYWVRSSADGRYVGYGLYTSSKIVDLAKPNTPITVNADYDPYFFPTNDGFAFAGSHNGEQIRVCRQSLLSDVATAAAPTLTLMESKCASIGDDVYQSIGAALDGQRYFVTWGAHENDDGGTTITAPLPAAFPVNASTTFTPMVNNGLSYRAERAVRVGLPREGDMMLSPSSGLAATRFGDGRKQHGYRLRFVKAQGTGSSFAVQLPMAAEICMPGMKLAFSFDERFVATHQYVDRTEPSEAGLPEKSANIMLADLTTGEQIRITKMKAGQYALYPHFRADGWLYFLVRDMNTRTEFVVASDAAVRMAQ